MSPHKPSVQRWQLLIVFALLFVSIVTPYEVAVLPSNINAGYFINLFINLIFIIDMGVAFFSAYRATAKEGGHLIKDLRAIRRHYLRGWFAIDLISVLPLDMVSDKIEFDMKILRLVKLLRLTRLARLRKNTRLKRPRKNHAPPKKTRAHAPSKKHAPTRLTRPRKKHAPYAPSKKTRASRASRALEKITCITLVIDV